MPTVERITEQDYLNQLQREVNDPNGTVAPVLEVIWDLHDDQPTDRLHYLYAKRSALNIRLAEEVANVDVDIHSDLALKRDQRTTHLRAMRDETQVEIVRLEAQFRAGRGGRTGALTTVAPTVPPLVGGADANDPKYRGSPYNPTSSST